MGYGYAVEGGRRGWQGGVLRAARPQLKVYTLPLSSPLSLDSLRTFAAALSSNLDKLVRVPVRVVVITPVVVVLVVVAAAAAVIAVIIRVVVVVIADQQHTHRKKAKVIYVHRLAKG